MMSVRKNRAQTIGAPSITAAGARTKRIASRAQKASAKAVRAVGPPKQTTTTSATSAGRFRRSWEALSSVGMR